MVHKTRTTTLFLCSFFIALAVHGQQVSRYNLPKLLRESKLDTTSGTQTHELADDKKQAITTKGIVWLKNVTFKEGTIDIDLRGKNVFLQSFLGIAFHAKDTTTYDVVYFRPFRFHSDDVPTRKWSIQYMSMPDFDYDKLRKLHPLVYENEVNPAPAADDWFHAAIVVKGGWITVYVNHSSTPSLKVKELNEIGEGRIGLWSSVGALTSDFANLSITE